MLVICVVIMALCKVARSESDHFIWISARYEGFGQHWKQLNDIWSYTVHNCPTKALRMVPYFNIYHNKDMKKYIDFCNYLVLPKEIVCNTLINEYPEEIVKKYTCSTPCIDKNWDCNPQAYGLNCPNFTACGVLRRKTDFCADECSLFYGAVGQTHSYRHFRIQFHPRFQPFFNLIINDLGQNRDAVHWRRGDQLSERCQKVDFSVNCENSTKLVQKIRNLTTEGSTVYISTNEADSKQLKVLTEAGYFIWSTLSISRMSLNFTSADIFFLELMIMTYARNFFFWGHSTVPDMVNIARHQNSVQTRKRARNNRGRVIRAGA